MALGSSRSGRRGAGERRGAGQSPVGKPRTRCLPQGRPCCPPHGLSPAHAAPDPRPWGLLKPPEGEQKGKGSAGVCERAEAQRGQLCSGRGASLETSPLESHFPAPPAVLLLPNNESFLFLSGCVGPLLAPRRIRAIPPAEQPWHTVPWESRPLPLRPEAPHAAVPVQAWGCDGTRSARRGKKCSPAPPGWAVPALCPGTGAARGAPWLWFVMVESEAVRELPAQPPRLLSPLCRHRVAWTEPSPPRERARRDVMFEQM